MPLNTLSAHSQDHATFEATPQVAARLLQPTADDRMSHAPAGVESGAASAAREREPEWSGLAITHILVPLDGSALAECAVPFAALLARAFGAKITLLHVLEGHRGVAPGRQIDAVEWEMVRAEAHRHLARFESGLRASGLACGVELLQGRAAEQIVHFAKEHRVDLLVMASHGEGGLSGWVLSSTTQKVIARAHSSVLVVPAYVFQGARIDTLSIRKILLPLDCSPRAECILPLAIKLAEAAGAELILSHIVPEPELPRRMLPSQEDLALAAQVTERNRIEAERYLSELQSRLAAQWVRAEVRTVVSRRNVRAVCELAASEHADLVVVSAHGKTGDAKVRYGGIAARLIQECCRPVIVLQDLAGELCETTPAEEAARGHPGH